MVTVPQGIIAVPAGSGERLQVLSPLHWGEDGGSHFRADDIQIYCHLHPSFSRAALGASIPLVLPSFPYSIAVIPALGKAWGQFSD